MNALFQTNASVARYFRSSGTSVACPCNTPEDFRDPEFHLSFAGYGPQSYVSSPGNIPANTAVSYVFVGMGAGGGVPMSPAILFPRGGAQIVESFDFQVAIDMRWPEGKAGFSSSAHFQIWRIVNAVYTFWGDIAYGSQTWIDDNNPIGGNPPYVEPVICNEAGQIIQTPVDVSVKAFVQPIQSTRATRLSTEYLQELFGIIEADDHLGIFPVQWGGVTLDFNDWSQSGDDFIEYNGQRFYVINANMIPDPGDGNPEHHWELGLRLIRSDGLGT